jgi:hypothetical protein
MEYHYYIHESLKSTDNQGLKTGTSIIKISSDYIIDFKYGDGPYKSLRGLKRNSEIFKLLQTNNNKRAQQIVIEKNIIVCEELMFVKKGLGIDQEVVDAFMHATLGKIQKGNLSGIHFFNPKKTKVLEIIEFNSHTNVFKARFEFYDFNTKTWVEKKTPSTFFPQSWDLSTLLMEIKFALEKIDPKSFKDGKIKSITKSNIEIEIVIKNGVLKSLYPLI